MIGRFKDMKTDRSQCAIFWMVSAKAQAALMKAHFDDDHTKLNIPPAQDTSSNWEPPESPEDIEKIMREAPRHVRRVD